MRHRYIPLLVLWCLSLVTSCSDDNDTWSAPVQLDYLELLTDASGRTALAVTDEGDTLSVSNPLDGLKADTAYRYVAVNERLGSSLRLSSCAPAIAPIPTPMEGMEEKTDSVEVVSIWRGGRYINLVVQMEAQDKAHYFGFKHKGVTDKPDGSRTAQVLLYHNQNGDVKAFHRTVYLSCPLKAWTDTLRQGRDSVAIRINVKDKGMQTWQFPL